MIKSLKDIPRIGQRTAGRLIEHFGSEKSAIDSLLNQDIAGITEIEGMTEKSAISMIQEAQSVNEGVNRKDFLRTTEANEIYEQILDLISDHANSSYAKNKLRLYIPYPAKRSDRIIELQREMANAIELAAKLDRKELSGFLSRIRPIKTNYSVPVIRDRVIITEDPEEFEIAKKFPVSVQIVSNTGEIVDIARGYSHVIMNTGFAGMDLPDDIDIEIMDIRRAEMWQVAPEKELAFFSRNLDSINSAISVIRIIRQFEPDFCRNITDDVIEKLSSGLVNLSSSNDLKSGLDSEIDRYQSIYDDLGEIVVKHEKQANIEYSSLIEKSSITVSGFDLLSAVDGGINRIFEKEIREKYELVIDHTITNISVELDLTPVESQYVNNFFPDEVSHPIKLNPGGMESLKNHLLRKITSRKIELLKSKARKLSPLRETASIIVRKALEFDVSYTVGCFAREHSLFLPVIQDHMGIGIKDGINLFIDQPVPVNYAIGKTKLNEGLKTKKDARIVLLSGVNSGGKTTTINLLAQIIILTHMGFPVPAKQCEVGLIEEFYYFGKSKGTMDAGAFESTIRDFSAVANNKSKIVLTDEMESITEPGASAKIISGILEELYENNGIGVFVSHLAESILKNTEHEVRVDGIEAKGLDEHLNLIVDRNPRYNYLARSTPELIVERLALKNKESDFFKRLLKKFR